MKQMIFASLLSNAATLGVHWIYNHTYLEETSKSRSLLFTKQDKMFYDNAKPSFYVYPDHEVGQITVQGEILRWLYETLKLDPKLSQSDYEALLYEKFRPGGAYHGYVETYAKKMVQKNMSKELQINIDDYLKQDTHLVGFMPYLATKALDLSIQKAWELAQLFTDNQHYLTYYLYFDVLFELIKDHGLKDAIKRALPFAPDVYKEKLEKAISIKDTNTFIKAYAGRACSIDQAIPVIMHILYHTENFTEALELNAIIGGASSDRGLLIGAILNEVYQIPVVWIKKVYPYLSK